MASSERVRGLYISALRVAQNVLASIHAVLRDARLPKAKEFSMKLDLLLKLMGRRLPSCRILGRWSVQPILILILTFISALLPAKAEVVLQLQRVSDTVGILSGTGVLSGIGPTDSANILLIDGNPFTRFPSEFTNRSIFGSSTMQVGERSINWAYDLGPSYPAGHSTGTLIYFGTDAVRFDSGNSISGALNLNLAAGTSFAPVGSQGEVLWGFYSQPGRAVSVGTWEMISENNSPFSGEYSSTSPFECGAFILSKRCPGYGYTFDGSSFTISLEIGLRGSPDQDLTKIWERGIEEYWGSSLYGERHQIVDGANAYPIYFDVNFVGGLSPADLYVDVVAGKGRDNTKTWYTDMSSYGNDFQDEKAAHEFGHYLGLYDEYLGASLGPFGLHCDIGKSMSDSANIDCDGLMGDLRHPTLPRYYDQILAIFESETGRDVVLGDSPFLPPVQSNSDFIGDFGESNLSVPEPGTLWLLAIGFSCWQLQKKWRSRQSSCSI